MKTFREVVESNEFAEYMLEFITNVAAGSNPDWNGNDALEAYAEFRRGIFEHISEE